MNVTMAVKMDCANIMKGTDVNENAVNTILLKMTIMNELDMYSKIEGQCIL
tara:strand:- start:538 stop:690 length:153 start_codon:yes stop_codon:yes gene_type:complete